MDTSCRTVSHLDAAHCQRGRTLLRERESRWSYQLLTTGDATVRRAPAPTASSALSHVS